MSEQWFTGPMLDLQAVDGNLRQTHMECTVTIMTPMFTGIMYARPLRSRMARFDVRGEVLATFYPKNFNRWNCRQGDLFLRKWRGNRGRFWTPWRRRVSAVPPQCASSRLWPLVPGSPS